MAALFASPWFQPSTGLGVPYAGAKLYFYLTGTTTPQAVYSDSGLSVPLTNPVVADADGVFPPIYLGTGDYKVILKTSGDVTLETADPVSGLTALNALTTRGDLLTRDADNYKRVPIGASGKVLRSNGVEPEWGDPVTPYQHIYGLTYTNSVGDATNDITIAPGAAMDATQTRMLGLGASITKRLDAAWVVGNNQGGLDTGSIADTDYLIYLITRVDTGVVDVLFSTGVPTLPADYSLYRLIGWFRRASSAIRAFETYETAGGGIRHDWKSPTLDADVTISTSAQLLSPAVPGLRVEADMNVQVTNSTHATDIAVNISNPYQTDQAPSVSAAPLGNTGEGIAISLDAGAQTVDSATLLVQRQIRCMTNTSGQVQARATASCDLKIATVGFNWSRR